MNLTALETAYLAGFFDRGGRVEIRRHKRKGRQHKQYTLRVVMFSHDRDMLENFRTKSNLGAIYESDTGFRWEISSQEAITFLHYIDDFVLTRTRELEIAYQFARTMRAGRYPEPTYRDLQMRQRAYELIKRR